MGLIINLIKRPVRLQHKTVRVAATIPAGTSAYVANDVMGGVFEIPLPSISGTITNAVLHDLDNEGTQVDVFLATRRFTGAGDNDPFSLSDDDNLKALILLKFTLFENCVNNQFSTLENVNKDFVAPGKWLYAQAITRSTPTIAAGSQPVLVLTIRPDDPGD